MIEIRNMMPGDVAAVARIEQEIFSQPWSEKGFLDAINLGDTVFLVAEQQGQIVGYIGMYFFHGRRRNYKRSCFAGTEKPWRRRTFA